MGERGEGEGRGGERGRRGKGGEAKGRGGGRDGKGKRDRYIVLYGTMNYVKV